MSKRLFKTLVAVLAIAAAAAGPVRGQSITCSADDLGKVICTDGSIYATVSAATTAGKTAAAMIAYVDETNLNGLALALAEDVPMNWSTANGTSGAAAHTPTVTGQAWKLPSEAEFKQMLKAFGGNEDSYTGLNTAVTNAGGTPFVTEDEYWTSTEHSSASGRGTVMEFFDESNYVDWSWSLYASSHRVRACFSFSVVLTPKYTVRMAAGTEEAANWSIASGDASVPGTQVLENVMSGSQVTATYNGTTKKVKSVKAVKYVPPAATVTTAPTATDAYIEVGSTAALVNAGTANGGTMMYAVTTTNAQPASTADFSATRPTAEGRTAGTYYVWYYAKADADHSDSEIAGPVSVPLATTVTWNSSNISDLEVMGNFQSYTMEGITLSANSEMNGARWQDRGDESRNGISFEANESGGFTFTAPTGKKFTKIEMTPNSPGGWDLAGLGTGWAYSENIMNMIFKATWTGSAASTVGLLTGANNFGGEAVKSIVFTLIDAQ